MTLIYCADVSSTKLLIFGAKPRCDHCAVYYAASFKFSERPESDKHERESLRVYMGA